LIGDFPPAEINVIVSQHKKYGMINCTDLAANVNLGKMIPYIYSIGAPVSDADYATLMNNNFPPPYNYGSARRINGGSDKLVENKTQDAPVKREQRAKRENLFASFFHWAAIAQPLASYFGVLEDRAARSPQTGTRRSHNA
jgi:hypothetical protein